MGAKPDRSELKTYIPMPDLKDEFWLRVKLPIAKRRQRHPLWKLIHGLGQLPIYTVSFLAFYSFDG